MATEAVIIQEPVSIVEKIATESVLIQEPISIVEKMATEAVTIQEPISIVKTAESKHLTLEVAANNKGIETAYIVTEGNTEISKVESFLVSPEISMVANETSGMLEHTEVDGTPLKEENILEDKEKTVVQIKEEDRTRDGIEKGDMDHGSEELDKQASMDSHNPIVDNLPSMVAESEVVACVHEPEENKCVNGESDASQDENLFDTSSIKKTKELHSQASDIRMENIVEECPREETGQCEIDEKTDQDFSMSNELCKDDANSESEKVAVDAIQAADKELAVTEALDEMEIDEGSAIAMPKEYVTEAEHVSTPNEKPANPMNAVYKDANIDISGETAKTSISIEEATSVKDHEDRSEGDGRETMSVKEVHEESEMEASGTGKENPETKEYPIPDISDSSIRDETAKESMKEVESSLMKLTEEATNSNVTEMDSVEQRAKPDNDPSPFDEKDSKEEIQQTLEADLVHGSSFELKESRMDTEEEITVKEDEAEGEKNVVAVKEIGLATTEHDVIGVEGANIDANSMDFSVTCEKNVEAPKPREEDGMQDKIPNAVSEDRMEMTTEDVPLKEAIGDEVKEHSTIPSEEYETTEERKITDETLEKDRAYKHLEKVAVDVEVVPDTDKKPAVTGALDEMKREEESTVLTPEGKLEKEIPIQQKNEPEKEMPSCPLNVVHEDVNTAISRETTETSTSIREKTSVENHEERSEREGREDSSTEHQQNEVNENTKTMELEISNDNADDLHVTDSSVQQSAENEDEKQFEFSDVQPEEQVDDAMVAVKEKEKVSEDASKASQSSDYTIPEHIFTEAAATDLKSETSQMGNENTMFVKEEYYLNSGNGSECNSSNNKHKGIQQELNDHIEDNTKHEETKEVTEKLELDNTVENDGKQILEEDTNNDQITLKEVCEGSETEVLGTAKEEITLIEVKEELVCSSSFELEESKMTADLDCTSQAVEMLETNLKDAKAEAEEEEEKNEIYNVVDGEDHGNGLGRADIDAKSAESCMTGEKDIDIPQEEDRMQDKILNAGSENQMEMTTDEIPLKDILGVDVKEHSAMHSEENNATLLEERKLVDETSEEDQAQQKHSENVVVDVKVVHMTGEELTITKGSEEMRKDKESIVPMPEGEISEVENIGLAQKNQEGNSEKDEILEESFKQKNEPEKENHACPWDAVSEDVNTAICAETAETSTSIEEATPVKDHDERSEGETREDLPTDHVQPKASQSNETVEVEISNENADDLHVTGSFGRQLMDNEHEKQYKFSDVELVENEALEHKEESIQEESENRSALPKDAKENVEDKLNQEETKEVREGSTSIVKEECAIINDSLKATEENENEATPEVEVCEKLEPDNTVENSEKQILEEEDNKKDQTTLMTETMEEKEKEENTAAVVSITEESKEEIAPIEVKEDHVPSSSVELGESKNDTEEETSASCTVETEKTNIKEADAELEKEKNQKCNVVVIEENSSARTEHEQIGVSSAEIDVKSGDSYVTHEKDMKIPEEEDAMQDKVRNAGSEDQLEMTTKEIPLKEILGDEVKEYEATLIEERKITDETSEKDHDSCEHSETPMPQVTDEKLIRNEDNPLADVPKAEPEDTGNDSRHEVKEQLAEESDLDVTDVSTGEEHRELENQTDACKAKTLPVENSSDVGLERSKFEDGKPLDETMHLETTLGTCKDGEKATEEENSAKNIEKTESLKEDAQKEKENQIPEMVTMTYNAKVADYSSVSTECFMEAESKEQIVAENLEVKEHSTNDGEASHITKELEEMRQAEESGDPVSLRSKDREAEEKTEEIIDDSKPCHEESCIEAVTEVTAETSLNDTDKIVNASNISSAETSVGNIKSDAQETEVEIVQLEEISSESDPNVRTNENDEVQKQNLNMETVHKDEAEVAEKLEPDNTVENDGKQILEEEDTNNNQIPIEEVSKGSETAASGTAKEEITPIEVKEELVCSSSSELEQSKMDTEEAATVKEYISTAELDCTSQAAETGETNLKEDKAEPEEEKNEINNVVDGEDDEIGLESADINVKSKELCVTSEDIETPREEDTMQDKIPNAGSENQMEMTIEEIPLKEVSGDDVKEGSTMPSEENDATPIEEKKIVDETSEEDQALYKHPENVVDAKVVQETDEELAITKGSDEMRKDEESIVPMPEVKTSEVENVGFIQKNQEENSHKDEIQEESFKQKNEPEEENHACPLDAVSEDVNTAICAKTAETSTSIEEATSVKDHDERSEGETREDSPTDHLQTKASDINETVEVEISNEKADDLHVIDSYVGQLVDNDHEKQYELLSVQPVENEALEHKEESILQQSENCSAQKPEPKDAMENLEQEETKEIHEGLMLIVKEECAIINDSLKATEENENEATPEVEVCEKLEPHTTVANAEKQILEEEDNKKDQTTLMTATKEEKAKEENTAAVVSITVTSYTIIEETVSIEETAKPNKDSSLYDIEQESKEEITPIEVKEDQACSSEFDLKESKNETGEEISASYPAETEETNIKEAEADADADAEAEAEREKRKNEIYNVVVIEENSSARTEHEESGVCSAEIDVKSGDSYITHEKDMEIPEEEDAVQDKVPYAGSKDQLEMTTKEIPLKETLGDEVKEYEATFSEERKITDETSDKDQDQREHSETPMPQITDEKLIQIEDNPLVDVPKAESKDTGNESGQVVEEQLAEESNLEVTDVSTVEEHRELENQTNACEAKALPVENPSDVGLDRSKIEDGNPLDEAVDLEATLGTQKDDEKATEEEKLAKNIEKPESLKEDTEIEKENQIPEMATMTYNAKVEDYSSVSTECFMEAESKEQIVAENLEVKEHSTNDGEASHITKELEEMRQAEESGDPVSLRSKDREAEEKTEEIIDDSKPCHEESRLEAVTEITAETSLNDTNKIVNASNISSAETSVRNIKSDAQETEVEIVQLEEKSSESDPDVRTNENDEVQKQNLNMETVDKDEAEVAEKLEPDKTVENDGKQIVEEEDTNNNQITIGEVCRGSETAASGTAEKEITIIEFKEELVCSSSLELEESKMDTEEETAVNEHIDTADFDCTSQAAETAETNLKEAKAESEEEEKKEINNVVDGEDEGIGLGSADIDVKSVESYVTSEKDIEISREEDGEQDKFPNAGSENQMEMTPEEILLKEVLGDDVKEHSTMPLEKYDTTLIEERKIAEDTSEEDQDQHKHSENVAVDVRVIQVTDKELAITKGLSGMRKDEESIVPMPEVRTSEVENIGVVQKNQEENSHKDEIQESFKQKNESEKENHVCPLDAVSEDVNTAIWAETAETNTSIEEATSVKDHDERSDGETREDSPTDHVQPKASQSNETVEVEISNENADDLHVTDTFVGQLMDNEHEKQYKFSDVEPVENKALEHKEESILQESENRSALPKDAMENVEENLNQEETKEVHEGPTSIVKEECAIINDSLKATEENENEATPEVEVSENLEPDGTVENTEKQILEEEDNKKDQTSLMTDTMKEKAEEEKNAAVVSITEETASIEETAKPNNDSSLFDIIQESKEETTPIEVKEDHVCSLSLELKESKKDIEEETSASCVAETEETNIKETEAHAEVEKEKNEINNVVVIEENSLARSEHEESGVCSAEIDVKSGDSHVTHEKDMEKEEDAMQDKVPNAGSEDQLEMTTKEIPLKEILGDEVKEYEATLIEERKITDETSEKDQGSCEHSETPVPQITDEKSIQNEDNPLVDVPKAKPEDTGNESGHEVEEQLAEKSNLEVTDVSSGEEHRELKNQTDACEAETMPAENSSDVGLERSKFEDGKPLDGAMDLEATLGTSKDDKKATGEENFAKNIEKPESLKEETEMEKENQIPEMVITNYSAKMDDYSSVLTECVTEVETKEQIVTENLQVEEYLTSDGEASHITKEFEEMRQDEESRDPVSLHSEDREAEAKTEEIIDDSNLCYKESRIEAVTEVREEKVDNLTQDYELVETKSEASKISKAGLLGEIDHMGSPNTVLEVKIEEQIQTSYCSLLSETEASPVEKIEEEMQKDDEIKQECRGDSSETKTIEEVCLSNEQTELKAVSEEETIADQAPLTDGPVEQIQTTSPTLPSEESEHGTRAISEAIEYGKKKGEVPAKLDVLTGGVVTGEQTLSGNKPEEGPTRTPLVFEEDNEENIRTVEKTEEEKIYEADMIPDKISEEISVADTTAEICLEKEEFLELDDGKNDDTEKEDEKTNEGELIRNEIQEDAKEAKTALKICSQIERSVKPEAVAEDEMTVSETLTEKTSDEQIQNPTSALPSKEEECERTITDEMIESVKTQDYNEEDASLQKDRLQEDEALAVDDNASSEVIPTEKHKDLPNPADTLPTDHLHLTTSMLPSEVQGDERKETELEEDENPDKIPEQTRKIEEASDFNTEIHEKASKNELLNETEDAAIHEKLVKARTETGEIILNEVSIEKVILEAQKTSENENPIEDKTVEDPVQASDARIETATATEENVELALAGSEEKPESDSEPVAEDQSKEPIPEDTKSQDDKTNTDAQNKETENQIKEEQKDNLKDEDSVNKDKNTNKVVSEEADGSEDTKEQVMKEESSTNEPEAMLEGETIISEVISKELEQHGAVIEEQKIKAESLEDEESSQSKSTKELQGALEDRAAAVHIVPGETSTDNLHSTTSTSPSEVKENETMETELKEDESTENIREQTREIEEVSNFNKETCKRASDNELLTETEDAANGKKIVIARDETEGEEHQCEKTIDGNEIMVDKDLDKEVMENKEVTEISYSTSHLEEMIKDGSGEELKDKLVEDNKYEELIAETQKTSGNEIIEDQIEDKTVEDPGQASVVKIETTSVTEENVAIAGFEEKSKSETEAVAEEQSKETIPEHAKSLDDETSIGVQNQETEEQIKEELKDKLEDEDSISSEQNTNVVTKAVILSEEVDKEVEKVDGIKEIKEHVMEEESSSNELHPVSKGDEATNEVKDYSAVSTECIKVAVSKEQIKAEVEENSTNDKEGSDVTKEIEERRQDEDSRDSIKEHGEDREEKIKEIIDDSNFCHQESPIEAMTEVIAGTSLNNTEVNEELVNTANISSVKMSLETIESDSNQETKEIEKVQLEETSSNLAPEAPTNNDDEAEITERDLKAFYMPKDQIVEAENGLSVKKLEEVTGQQILETKIPKEGTTSSLLVSKEEEENVSSVKKIEEDKLSEADTSEKISEDSFDAKEVAETCSEKEAIQELDDAKNDEAATAQRPQVEESSEQSLPSELTVENLKRGAEANEEEEEKVKEVEILEKERPQEPEAVMDQETIIVQASITEESQEIEANKEKRKEAKKLDDGNSEDSSAGETEKLNELQLITREEIASGQSSSELTEENLKHGAEANEEEVEKVKEVELLEKEGPQEPKAVIDQETIIAQASLTKESQEIEANKENRKETEKLHNGNHEDSSVGVTEELNELQLVTKEEIASGQSSSEKQLCISATAITSEMLEHETKEREDEKTNDRQIIKDRTYEDASDARTTAEICSQKDSSVKLEAFAEDEATAGTAEKIESEKRGEAEFSQDNGEDVILQKELFQKDEALAAENNTSSQTIPTEKPEEKILNAVVTLPSEEHEHETINKVDKPEEENMKEEETKIGEIDGVKTVEELSTEKDEIKEAKPVLEVETDHLHITTSALPSEVQEDEMNDMESKDESPEKIQEKTGEVEEASNFKANTCEKALDNELLTEIDDAAIKENLVKARDGSGSEVNQCEKTNEGNEIPLNEVSIKQVTKNKKVTETTYSTSCSEELIKDGSGEDEVKENPTEGKTYGELVQEAQTTGEIEIIENQIEDKTFEDPSHASIPRIETITVTEENVEPALAGFEEKPKSDSEPVAEERRNETIPEDTKSQDDETSQETKEHITEELKDKLKDEDYINREENANEVTKVVVLSEKVDKEVGKADGSEAIKEHVMEEESSTNELPPVSRGDEANKAKDYNSVSTECIKETESREHIEAEQTEVERKSTHDKEGSHIIEQLEERRQSEESTDPAKVSSEDREAEEKAEIIDDLKLCHEESHIEVVTELRAQTSLNDAVNEELINTLNISSVKMPLETIKGDANQETKEVEMGQLEDICSDLAPEVPLNDNIEVEVIKRDADALYMHKDQVAEPEKGPTAELEANKTEDTEGVTETSSDYISQRVETILIDDIGSTNTLPEEKPDEQLQSSACTLLSEGQNIRIANPIENIEEEIQKDDEIKHESREDSSDTKRIEEVRLPNEEQGELKAVDTIADKGLPIVEPEEKIQTTFSTLASEESEHGTGSINEEIEYGKTKEEIPTKLDAVAGDEITGEQTLETDKPEEETTSSPLVSEEEENVSKAEKTEEEKINEADTSPDKISKDPSDAKKKAETCLEKQEFQELNDATNDETAAAQALQMEESNEQPSYLEFPVQNPKHEADASKEEEKVKEPEMLEKEGPREPETKETEDEKTSEGEIIKDKTEEDASDAQITVEISSQKQRSIGLEAVKEDEMTAGTAEKIESKKMEEAEFLQRDTRDDVTLQKEQFKEDEALAVDDNATSQSTATEKPEEQISNLVATLQSEEYKHKTVNDVDNTEEDDVKEKETKNGHIDGVKKEEEISQEKDKIKEAEAILGGETNHLHITTSVLPSEVQRDETNKTEFKEDEGHEKIPELKGEVEEASNFKREIHEKAFDNELLNEETKDAAIKENIVKARDGTGGEENQCEQTNEGNEIILNEVSKEEVASYSTSHSEEPVEDEARENVGKDEPVEDNTFEELIVEAQKTSENEIIEKQIKNAFVEDQGQASAVRIETTTESSSKISIAEGNQILDDIQRTDETTKTASDKQIPREFDLIENMEITSLVVEEYVRIDLQDRVDPRKAEIGDVKEIYSGGVEHAGEKTANNSSEEIIKESVSMEDLTKISSSDHVKSFTKGTSQLTRDMIEREAKDETDASRFLLVDKQENKYPAPVDAGEEKEQMEVETRDKDSSDTKIGDNICSEKEENKELKSVVEEKSIVIQPPQTKVRSNLNLNNFMHSSLINEDLISHFEDGCKEDEHTGDKTKETFEVPTYEIQNEKPTLETPKDAARDNIEKETVAKDETVKDEMKEATIVEEHRYITNVTFDKQIPGEKDPIECKKTTNSIGKQQFPTEQQDEASETSDKIVVGDLEPRNAQEIYSETGPDNGKEKRPENAGAEKSEEPESEDSAKLSLYDLLQRSTRELQGAKNVIEEKELVVSKEEPQEEEAKTDEDEGDENSKTEPGIKPHKKSHNILSGVGSKVKNSISKMKKAITGKSSHSKESKPISPKESKK
ncbi:titin-like isoform X2 [Gossypium australe]|uniref:Titin-like isoform X2 n=2 Tax=Gossypium australe TaxID=47621 RepID=A0A5B6URG9_9ROSI|nr:titin-like isoform X2 [Gossypium australe]